MMTAHRLYARTSALPAIAAALALSSTPVLAQETVQPLQPVTIEPAAPMTDVPAPAPSEPAATADTSTTPAATVAAPPTTAKRTVQRATTRTTRIAAAKPAPVAIRTTARTVTQTTLPASTAAAQPAAVAPPPPAPEPTTVAPAPAQMATVKPVNTTDETLPIAAGGALALLALGGTAVALTRRRRRQEEDWVDEQPASYDTADTMVAPRPQPVIHEEQPAIVAPSAFAWGSMPQGDQARANESSSDEDDRRPGESWVERAYRGPSSNNPSASLRNRLKRAAFFDKREREAAAGLAAPVDGSAGLPDAMIEEQERELA